MEDVGFRVLRGEMVKLISAQAALVGERTGRPVLDGRVLAAMGAVARHEFVPREFRAMAYDDNPLPIGYEKTVSQPFIVALMTDLLDIGRRDRVLEIGTGLGYQAAVLSHLAGTVYSMEIIGELAVGASRRLRDQGCDNVHYRRGDGYQGWPEHGPYDAVIVTAAPDLIPPPLLQQLKPGGRMVIPAGMENDQQLILVMKDEKGRIKTEEILPVRFSTLITDNE